MMPLQPFQQFQREFGRFLRDPHHVPRPAGVPARAAAVYQELLFNNVCGFLDKCFPVCRQILGEARWRRVNRSFYRDWPLHSPLFRFIPSEFVKYLATAPKRPSLPAWMPELAKYEWVELAVDIHSAEALPHDPDGDLITGRVVVNPALMNLSFQWPVHLIGPDYRPRKMRATYLVVFRDAALEVRFCELNAVTARLLEVLMSGEHSGEGALRVVAEEIGHTDVTRLIEFGRGVLTDLQRQGVILGVQVQSPRSHSS